jgi:arylsulfatase A-like enzyme
MKIIRLLLLALTIHPPVIALAAEGAEASPRPNFIFIIADDLGISDVGCYGSTAIRTPNIDRLAREGLRATAAHASASVCTPSRYAILTGENYWRFPRPWEGQALVGESTPTIARSLKAAGYATGYFGKWHLGWGETVPDKPRAHRSDLDWNVAKLPTGVIETGYDTFFGTPWSANEPPMVFVHDHAVVGLDPADPIRILGPKEEKYYGYGISKGARAAHEACPLERIDLIVAERAADYIRNHREKPFYLHVSLVAPHVPIAPAPEFRKRTKIGPYGDFTEQMDACVGKIIEAIESAKLAENTFIIFTSDNGAILNGGVHRAGHRSNGNLLGQKTDAWQGGVNVPFIARWPGKIPAGVTMDRLIALNDFFATACAAAGVQVPNGAARDSLNQLPVLLDPTLPPVRTEMTYTAISPPQIALRSGNWVYIPAQGSLGVTTDPKHDWAMQFGELGLVNSDYHADGSIKPDAAKVQLYDLSEDPHQHVNLAPRRSDVVDELDARLKDIRKKR